MHLRRMLSQAEKFVADNSPLILTAIGVTGSLTTAYLAGKASFKAAEILADEVEAFNIENALEGNRRISHFSLKTAAKTVWKLYIPAISVGAVTVTSIICANRIGTRRAAAIATAYSISEKAFVEYKDKVVEKMGESAEQKVRDEVAQDRVDRTDLVPSKVIITEKPEMLCLDAFSGRYFKCDMETIRSAVNDVNEQILHSDYATLDDFYDKIGLDHTSVSGELGWNTDRKLSINYSSTLKDEKEPCMVLEFTSIPVRNPFQIKHY